MIIPPTHNLRKKNRFSAREKTTSPPPPHRKRILFTQKKSHTNWGDMKNKNKLKMNFEKKIQIIHCIYKTHQIFPIRQKKNNISHHIVKMKCIDFKLFSSNSVDHIPKNKKNTN